MRDGLWIVLLLCFLGSIGGGCQKYTDVQVGQMRPFGAVHIEFSGKPTDKEVEEIIDNQLFGSKGIFSRPGEIPSLYTLKVTYSRNVGLKGLGYMFLTGALAPIEADFFYSLQMEVLKNDTSMKTYTYTRVTREETSSALESIFNPFHKENGRSVEVYGQLAKKFRAEFIADPLLPPIENNLSN